MNIQTMSHDSIVEEIHRVRHELAEQYHHDLDALAKAADEKALALGFTTQRPSLPADVLETKVG